MILLHSLKWVENTHGFEVWIPYNHNRTNVPNGHGILLVMELMGLEINLYSSPNRVKPSRFLVSIAISKWIPFPLIVRQSCGL